MTEKELCDRLVALHRQIAELKEDIKQLKADAKEYGYASKDIAAIAKVASAIAGGKEAQIAADIKRLQDAAAAVGCEALAGEQLRMELPPVPSKAVENVVTLLRESARACSASDFPPKPTPADDKAVRDELMTIPASLRRPVSS